MKNVLIRNLTKEQSKLIKEVMKINHESTATKAILKALEEYVPLKKDFDSCVKDKLKYCQKSFDEIKSYSAVIEREHQNIIAKMSYCKLMTDHTVC